MKNTHSLIGLALLLVAGTIIQAQDNGLPSIIIEPVTNVQMKAILVPASTNVSVRARSFLLTEPQMAGCIQGLQQMGIGASLQITTTNLMSFNIQQFKTNGVRVFRVTPVINPTNN